MIDIVRRNSILVTHGSLRVKLMIACILKVLMQRYSFCVSHMKLLVSSLFWNGFQYQTGADICGLPVQVYNKLFF